MIYKWTSNAIKKVLEERHFPNGNEWIYASEVRAGTGFSSYKWKKVDEEYVKIYEDGINVDRTIDFFAINCYPSKSFNRIAYEIKISRSDFLQELRDPEKMKPFMELSNEFYFVAPKGLISKEELPEDVGLVEVYRKEELNFNRVRVPATYRKNEEPNTRFYLSFMRSVIRDTKKNS